METVTVRCCVFFTPHFWSSSYSRCVCDRETADGFSSAVGESGRALTGRWKMICSPNHIYHPNTIWVPSHVHASAQTHGNSPTCTCALMHLLGEQQGQEVWGLIERTHGATVTLTVKVFIRGRWLVDYATANVTKRIWAFWKNSICAKLRPPKSLRQNLNNEDRDWFTCAVFIMLFLSVLTQLVIL